MINQLQVQLDKANEKIFSLEQEVSYLEQEVNFLSKNIARLELELKNAYKASKEGAWE